MKKIKKRKNLKKKRVQPAPKKKSQNVVAKNVLGNINPYMIQMKTIGKRLKEFLKDKDSINAILQEHIRIIEGYFQKYDSVQLLGSIGLYLLDNLPNIEKYFYAQISGHQMDLDENAEVIAEYALNFGLAMPNIGMETPTDEIVNDLRTRLKTLFFTYVYYDMPLEKNAGLEIDWMIHMDTISVRGDGYQTHVYEVFKELFSPHSTYYQNQFGYSIEQLFDFFIKLEDRIICKIASQNEIYGAAKMWERWREWEGNTYGATDDDVVGDKDFSNGLFGDFFEANPDVPHTKDGMFLLYHPDDYKHSDRIFWVYPQNDIERKILESLSVELGANVSFLADGEFRGSIMNGHTIFEKPFVKDGGRYYCFTPMIPHRNLFLIAEKLMMQDNTYYQTYFQQNTMPISRDVYIENKVKSVMQSFLPAVSFYSTAYYTIDENGFRKRTELYILGISDRATYIIEVKAHELSYKDRVKLSGAKSKFKDSVYKACEQCCRAADYVENATQPVFSSQQMPISVDKFKPVYKIVVTFQQYSPLTGQLDKLVTAGWMEERFRDVWVVSLFDLMTVSDFLESEDEFIAYLDMRKIINTNHSTYHDELDLLGQFLNNGLAEKVKSNVPMIVIDGSRDIDEEYAKDYHFPLIPS